jgi:signal peptidase I
MVRRAIVAACGILLAVVTVASIRRRWLFVRIDGSSMEPTLHSGQLVRSRRLDHSSVVSPGDVIVFRTPVHLAENSPPLRVKRVVAVAGADGRGQQQTATGRAIPTGFVEVAGDNPRSETRKDLGLISLSDVLARVQLNDGCENHERRR